MVGEPLVVLIGFLGAGKTSLLRAMVRDLVVQGWQPFVILNDYQNAQVDAQWLRTDLDQTQVMPLAGSCICCSGLAELRRALKNRPKRRRPITIIEANGTTSPIDLLAHLSIGIDAGLLPPIQLTPVHTRLWQQRGTGDALETLQLSTARLGVMTWLDAADVDRIKAVKAEMQTINPALEIWDQQQISLFPDWIAGAQKQGQTALEAQAFPAQSAEARRRHVSLSHWSSCEIVLPETMKESQLHRFLELVDEPNMRLKGCTKITEPDLGTIYFEKFSDGEVRVRPFPGNPAFGSRCIVIAPAVNREKIQEQLLAAQAMP